MRTLRVLAAGVGAAGLLASPAWAAVSTPVAASGPSPYAACQTPAAGGTLYRNAEVEPTIAANPARPGNLIGVWQQDRWSNGGANGLMAGYSFDGGRTWRRSTLPFGRCAPGGPWFPRASDPAVSFGPDGTAYATGLPLYLTATGGQAAVATAVSRDGGRTWGRYRTQIVSPLADKQWVTADPARPGWAYVVWDQYSEDAAGRCSGPAYFSRTSDYGRTWSRPQVIANRAGNWQTLGNQIFADRRTGTLYDFFTTFTGVRCVTPGVIGYVRSTDGGRTWSRQYTIDTMRPVGVRDPRTGQAIRDGGGLYSAAMNPRTGQLHLVWQDARFSGGRYDEAAYRTSTDGGRTWSPIRRANRPTGRPAFTPTVAVNSAGVVGVTYYDLRADDPATAEFTANYWFRSSSDGGRTFGGEQHVAGPFNLNAAPVARGAFLGDYQGMTTVGSTFVPFFAATNCRSTCWGNPTDIYAARVTARPPADVGSAASPQPFTTAAQPALVGRRR